MTIKRVLDAVERLGYIPNYTARIGKAKNTKVVGVVLDCSLRSSKNSMIVAGIVEKLETCGYRLFFCTSANRSGQYKGWLEDYFQFHLAGLIFLCNENRGLSRMDKKMIEQKRIPAVVFDSLDPDGPYSTVDFDYYKDAVRLMKRLLYRVPKQMLLIEPKRLSERERLQTRAVEHVLKEYPQVKCFTMTDTSKTLEELKADDIRNFSLNKGWLKQLLETVRDFGENDLILFHWYVPLPYVKRKAEEQRIYCRYAAFAQQLDYLSSVRDGIVSMDRMYYKAGQFCSELLLDEITEKQEGSACLHHKQLILNGNISL